MVPSKITNQYQKEQWNVAVCCRVPTSTERSRTLSDLFRKFLPMPQNGLLLWFWFPRWRALDETTARERTSEICKYKPWKDIELKITFELTLLRAQSWACFCWLYTLTPGSECHKHARLQHPGSSKRWGWASASWCWASVPGGQHPHTTKRW